MRFLIFNIEIKALALLELITIGLTYISFIQSIYQIPKFVLISFFTVIHLIVLLIVFYNTVKKIKIIESMLMNSDLLTKGRKLLFNKIQRRPIKTINLLNSKAINIRQEYIDAFSKFINLNHDSFNPLEMKEFFLVLSTLVQFNPEYQIKEKFLKTLTDIYDYCSTIELTKEDVFEISEHLREFIHYQFFNLSADRFNCIIFGIRVLGIIAKSPPEDKTTWDWMQKEMKLVNNLIESFDIVLLDNNNSEKSSWIKKNFFSLFPDFVCYPMELLVEFNEYLSQIKVELENNSSFVIKKGGVGRQKRDFKKGAQ